MKFLLSEGGSCISSSFHLSLKHFLLLDFTNKQKGMQTDVILVSYRMNVVIWLCFRPLDCSSDLSTRLHLKKSFFFHFTWILDIVFTVKNQFRVCLFCLIGLFYFCMTPVDGSVLCIQRGSASPGCVFSTDLDQFKG